MKMKIIFAALLLVVVAVLAKTTLYYRDKYTAEHTAANELRDDINDLQKRQASVNELDERHTQQLAAAKETISQLERDVAANKRRLHINAKCPTVPAGESSGTRSLGNAAAPALTADAERNYWHLRSGIAMCENQIKYLQDYIRQIVNAHYPEVNNENSRFPAVQPVELLLPRNSSPGAHNPFLPRQLQRQFRNGARARYR